jgi:hypothetical protein
MIGAIRSAVATVLVGAALVAGLVASIRGAHQARTEIRAQASLPRVAGQVDILHNTEQTRFVEFVAARVPQHDRIRIVMPPPAKVIVPRPVCGQAVPLGPYWVLVYALAPRASVCDGSARWVVYFGVAPPPGGILYRFAADYAVVRV